MERQVGNASTEKSASPNVAEYHSALSIGLFVGRYKITSVLGEGGFGITYRCHDTQLHREVAIKEYLPSTLAIRQGGTEVLPRSTAVSSDFVWGRSRFLEEARTLAKLSDVPGVVKVHDFLEAHGTAYVVMQLLAGETLAERLKSEIRLTQSQIEKILAPLLDGLEQIHAVGFVHRDIKPANIILAPDGSPTLIDFGASRAAVADRSQAMTAIFTPGFAAPEQASLGKQGPWTDIYGLAATLYACACGKAPPSALDRLLDDTTAMATDVDARDYSPTFRSAIDAGLLLQAQTRPQSIAQWREVFATGVWHSGNETQQGPESSARAQVNAEVAPAQTTINAPSSRSIQRLAVVALFFAVAAAFFYFTFFGSEKPKDGDGAQTGVPSSTLESRQPSPDVKPPDEGSQSNAQVSVDNKAREAEARRQTEEDRAMAPGQREMLNTAINQASEAQALANAEPDESRLRLTSRDRQRLQVALSSLGFEAGGIDGVFGPRSRQMIAAWQAKLGEPATGYLTAKQRQMLEGEGSVAIAKWEEAQKRSVAEEQRRQQQQHQQPVSPPPQRRSGWRWPWE